MRYVVAVSGGVDSVVLLDMLARDANDQLIVAHFDHGIRPASDADARFVWALAKKYGLLCEVRREELGAGADEATARERRYTFLRDMAKKYDATIVTAHHADDMVETIAINLVRGTGWRGLGVLAAPDVMRPLLQKRKRDIYEYALQHGLEWCEDETNRSANYLRNRLRQKLHRLDDGVVNDLFKLRQNQRALTAQINDETERLKSLTSRYFLTMIPDEVALEVLRAQTNAETTRPQLRELLRGAKTLPGGKQLAIGQGWQLHVSRRDYSVTKR